MRPALWRKYGVSQIGVSGSYARKEQVEGSDVDILVELAEPRGWDVFDLRDDREHLLGLKVGRICSGRSTGTSPMSVRDVTFALNDILEGMRNYIEVFLKRDLSV